MNIAKRINAALDAITRETPDPIVARLDSGDRAPNSGFSYHKNPKHGTPVEILREIGGSIFTGEIRGKIQTLANQWRQIYARLVEAGQAQPHIQFSKHCKEAALRARAGEEIKEPVRSIEWFETQRQSEMEGLKLALANITLEARQLIRPLVSKAAERARALLEAEVGVDRARWSKYGVPLEEPLEIHRSIHEAVKGLETAAKLPPPRAADGYTSPDTWAYGLIRP